MSDLSINFVPLDAVRAGVEEQLQRCIPDVMLALEQQEQEERRPGKIKVAIVVTFERRKDGATVTAESKVSAPARAATAGAYAQIVRGKMLVPDAEQQELLPRRKVRAINPDVQE